MKLIPVILSGGSGSRLWPLSDQCFPKQYLIFKNIINFLFTKNLFKIHMLSNPIIISMMTRFIVAEQMREIM